MSRQYKKIKEIRNLGKHYQWPDEFIERHIRLLNKIFRLKKLNRN